MKYYDDCPLVIKSWCNEPEKGALDQAEHLAHLPFAFKQICLMPDTHQGYGMPIGGVLATKGVIVPNAVGVDIGCGMCAVKTSLLEISADVLKKIMNEIRNEIPVGKNHYAYTQDINLMPPTDNIWTEKYIVKREFGNALTQLGTLGGGNHFIEIQQDTKGFIWIMLHSGSRNLGKQVADAYNRKAIDLNEKYFCEIPKEWQLAFLPVDDQIGEDYCLEMQFCVDFAYANRKLMMERICKIFQSNTTVEFGSLLNIAHNYARLENHFGSNVYVHRKGATSARKDEYGIIPGSQGTSSYIVKGKGNIESFKSCSHGAGRKMGRKEAQRTLNLKEEQEKLDKQGIIHSVRSTKDLDEASGSYKDIDTVMKEQEDLVEPIVKLKPLAVIKG
jgi:tRNA-splicing ligase RtcB